MPFRGPEGDHRNGSRSLYYQEKIKFENSAENSSIPKKEVKHLNIF